MLDDDGRKMMRAGARLSAIGFEIAICLLLGYFGGRWLDGWFETTPWLTIVGAGMGLGAAINVIYRIVKTTDLDKL